MKKILFILLFLIPAILRAYTILHLYHLDNNLTDSVGTANGSSVGTILYDNTVYHAGGYSAKGFADGVYWTVPYTVADELGVLSAWTISMWTKEPAQGTGYQLNSFLGVDDNFYGFTPWNALNGSWEFRLVLPSTVFYSPNWADNSDWSYISVEYTGTATNIYRDGALKYSVVNVTNCFNRTNSGHPMRFGREYYSGDYFKTYMDEVYIVNAAMSGIEPVMASPTFTPTITPTITQTITQTVTPTITPTITPTCGLCTTYEQWHADTVLAPWEPRIFSGSTVFDGYLWIIGGANTDWPVQEQIQYADAWYTDNGTDWVAATRNAEFGGLRRHEVVVFDAGSGSKMWVIAGTDNNGTWTKKVWNSSDGIIWNLITDTAAFGSRTGHQCVVFQDKIWVLSGQDQNGTYNPQNDAWWSTNGVDWVAATRNAEFNGRSGFTAWTYRNAMYISGGAGAGGATDDTWFSNDGIFWQRIDYTVDPALRSGIWEHLGSVIFDDKMYLFYGSHGNPGVDHDYAQWSVTGLWPWDYALTGYGARGGASVQTYNNKIYIMAGANNEEIIPTPLNDVWSTGYNQYCLSETPTFTITITPTFTPTATQTTTPTVTPTITPAACLLSADRHQSVSDKYFEIYAGLLFTPPTTKRPKLTTKIQCLSLNINLVDYYGNSCLVISRVPFKYNFAFLVALSEAVSTGVKFYTYATPTVTPTHT